MTDPSTLRDDARQSHTLRRASCVVGASWDGPTGGAEL